MDPLPRKGCGFSGRGGREEERGQKRSGGLAERESHGDLRTCRNEGDPPPVFMITQIPLFYIANFSEITCPRNFIVAYSRGNVNEEK